MGLLCLVAFGCGLTIDFVPEPDAHNPARPDGGRADAASDAKPSDADLPDVELDTSDRECESNSDCPNVGCTIGECDTRLGQCSERTVICPVVDDCRFSTGCDASGECQYELLVDDDEDGYAPLSLGPCGLDCDDSSSDVFPGASEVCNGQDDDCDDIIDEGAPDAMTCGADLDGDLHGSSVDFVWECGDVCPAGRVVGNDDCWDAFDPFEPGVPRAFNTWYGQPIHFTVAREDDGSYDWDCSGTDEVLWPSLARPCEADAPSCSAASGWADEVPMCGMDAGWLGGRAGVSGCLELLETRREAGK